MDPEWLDALRRNSGLRLTADGQFRFKDAPVPHPRVQRLFHQGIRVLEDGQVTLTVGEQWAYVSCEGVARFVERVATHGEGLLLSFLGGDELCSSEPRIAAGPDDRLYLWIADDAPPAVLLRAAHQRLSAWFVEGADGAVVLEGDWGSSVVAMAPWCPRPGTSWGEMFRP